MDVSIFNKITAALTFSFIYFLWKIISFSFSHFIILGFRILQIVWYYAYLDQGFFINKKLGLVVKSGENTNEIVDAFYIYETEFQKNQEKLKELRNP